MSADSKLVYSTDPNWKPGQDKAAAEAANLPGMPPPGQAIKVRREKNGRAGKIVTTLFEFQASDRQREELAKHLRKQLGTGGTVKDNVVELQGDQLLKALAQLAKLGYKPKQAGG